MNHLSEKDVVAFNQASIFLKVIYDHFRILYKNENTIGLLKNRAEWFFSDIQAVLISFIILEICKITDPAISMHKGKKYQNLTVNLFQQDMDFLSNAALKSKVEQLLHDMESFRSKVLEARNKRIAHRDYLHALDDNPLGTAKVEEYDIFFKNLEEFLLIVNQYYTNKPIELGSYSDAYRLISALKGSTFFDKILEREDMHDLCIEIMNSSPYHDA